VSAIPAAGTATQKKSLVASERDETARATWRTTHAALDPATCVLLDETSTHPAMTRRSARAPRGERGQSSAPRNHGPNVTLLATLTPHGIDAPDVQEGAVNRDVLTADIEQVLVPTLRPGQTVLMDNLNVHKGQQSRRAIEAVGCHVVFLPTSSPDFNPIELAYAKIKTALRRAAARTFDELVEAIREAIEAITIADARHIFRHCGYHGDDVQR
jgi:transposase